MLFRFFLKKNVPDESVNLGSVDVVRLLKRKLDLALVGSAVNNEDEGVHLLDLLHGALGVQGEQEHLVRVSTGRVGSALARVFRAARKTQGLGAVERGRGADLAHTLLARGALLDNLLGHVGLPRGLGLLLCFVLVC